MRVLVTGASGFVGNVLARRLVKDGHDVHLLLRPGHNAWRVTDLLTHVTVHDVNLNDKESLTTLVATVKPQWVFHLAAYGAYSSQQDWQQMIETNVAGTVNFLEACTAVGCDAFINTGSSSEYGFKDHPPTEDEHVDPASSYAVTKVAATHAARYFAQQKNLPAVTLRLYSVYGPYEEPTRLLPSVILHGLAGKLPPLVDPLIARDFVYVDDVVDAYIQVATSAADHAGTMYNVASGKQTTIGDVVDLACETLPITQNPEWGSMENRQWDTACWVGTSKKLTDDTGWKPVTPFPEGFKKMTAWFQEHDDMRAHYLSYYPSL